MAVARTWYRVVQHLEEVVTLLPRERAEPPVVQEEEVPPPQPLEPRQPLAGRFRDRRLA